MSMVTVNSSSSVFAGDMQRSVIPHDVYRSGISFVQCVSYVELLLKFWRKSRQRVKSITNSRVSVRCGGRGMRSASADSHPTMSSPLELVKHAG